MADWAATRGRRYANRRLCGDHGTTQRRSEGLLGSHSGLRGEVRVRAPAPRSHEPTKPSSDLPRLLPSPCAPPILKLGYYMTAGACFADIRIPTVYPDIR